MAEASLREAALVAESTKLKVVRVSLENRPGALGSAARALADRGINIMAVEAEVLGKYGFARFYTSDAAGAERVLREKGYLVSLTEVLEVLVEDQPGQLAGVCETLGRAKVNIESCFGSSWGTSGHSRVFMVVDNPRKAERALHDGGFKAYILAH